MIKGYSLHTYYGAKSSARPFNDVDVLLPRLADVWQLVRHLRREYHYVVEQSIGLIRTGNQWHSEIEISRLEDEIYLEWEILSAGFPISYLSFYELERPTQSFSIDRGPELHAPSREETLLILAAECFTRPHLLARDYMDCRFIMGDKRELDWKYIRNRARQKGLDGMVVALLEGADAIDEQRILPVHRVSLATKISQVVRSERSPRIVARDLRHRAEMRIFDTARWWRLLRLTNVVSARNPGLPTGRLCFLLPVADMSNSDIDVEAALDCIGASVELCDLDDGLIIVRHDGWPVAITPIGVFGVSPDNVLRPPLSRAVHAVARGWHRGAE